MDGSTVQHARDGFLQPPAPTPAGNTSVDGAARRLPAGLVTDDDGLAADANEHELDDDRSPSRRQALHDSCDPRRPPQQDKARLKKMPSELLTKTVSPFLKEHIPGLYAPVGKGHRDEPAPAARRLDAAPVAAIKDPNTRYCYRHRPDSKCRRAADETKMGIIQSVRPPLAWLGCRDTQAGTACGLTTRRRSSTASP